MTLHRLAPSPVSAHAAADGANTTSTLPVFTQGTGARGGNRDRTA
ncbi:hypothetical protein [Nonomuraea africana]